MFNWLNSISNEKFVLIVFGILVIVSITGIKNRAYYSKDVKQKNTLNHILNSKYELYKNRNLDVDWINRLYGIPNIILGITTPILIILTNEVVGIVFFASLSIISNLLVTRVVVNKYSPKKNNKQIEDNENKSSKKKKKKK